MSAFICVKSVWGEIRRVWWILAFKQWSSTLPCGCSTKHVMDPTWHPSWGRVRFSQFAWKRNYLHHCVASPCLPDPCRYAKRGRRWCAASWPHMSIRSRFSRKEQKRQICGGWLLCGPEGLTTDLWVEDHYFRVTFSINVHFRYSREVKSTIMTLFTIVRNFTELRNLVSSSVGIIWPTRCLLSL